MAWSRIIIALAREYGKVRVFAAARSRAVAIYAGVINGVRRSLVLALMLTCLLQVMTLSLIGMIVTAALLWGGDNKLLVLLGVFATLFVVPALGVAYLTAERTWLKAAGAAIVEEE